MTIPPPQWRNWLLRSLVVIVLVLAAWHLRDHWDQQRFEQWKAQTNPFLFFSMLAILPLFFVPVTPFFIVAGAVFPTWIAITGCAAGMAANCLLNFHLAQMGWLNWMKRWINRIETRGPGDNHRRLLHLAILIKLAPGPPTVVKNSILAMTGIPFAWYFALSWGFSMLYAVVLVVLGDSIIDANFARMAPALIILILLGAAVAIIRRRLQSH